MNRRATAVAIVAIGALSILILVGPWWTAPAAVAVAAVYQARRGDRTLLAFATTVVVAVGAVGALALLISLVP